MTKFIKNGRRLKIYNSAKEINTGYCPFITKKCEF